MAKYLVLAMTNPLPGRDSEFNEWYDRVAIPAYASLPHVRPLGRYRSVPHDGYEFEMKDIGFEYLSVYEIETDDLEAAFSEVRVALAKATEEGRYHFSQAIDKGRFFEPVFVQI
ncbi:hypothetical protein [Streptomyces cadmiisoli]|uniref:DUF4286 family protein n=1 Tax=Streptomyces cadmiisoli TaxID=2184053 RepID=A0A2Z4ISF3_9ACTN|nr:hypothetical protein [Streptomyces cadmiisoli]AWW35558.1 hypothetical protein DN051_01835 [Streptomyces cadmiisoli]